MLRRLKFRHRIALLVALAAMGLVTVTAVTLVLGRRSERGLSGIETRYVPLIELDRDLETTFAQIPRALEDAAGAAEEARIVDADRLRDQLVARMRSGADTIRDNGGDVWELERELAAYYTAARGVATAILAGVPAAKLGDEIETMRRTQQTFTADLDAATAPNRARLAAAFATARSSQRDALWIEIIVAVCALALMMLLSWGIVRRTVRSLGAVSAGVERLARGELDHTIDVETKDEFGDLARETNRTAVRLRDYLAEIQRQADEIARASRYKSEFLANMSHELRTPLNSIMILSQVLAQNLEGTLSEKQVELATVIHKSGEELLALINEVLDLAKVESGKQELEIGTVPLSQLEDYVRRMFLPLAHQKDLGFDLEIAPDLPASLRTDWARVSQILKNLISNAFKFTERGAVTVRIRRDGEQRIAIAVSDTGIGIATEKHDLIFEAFAQAESGTTRKYGGTGLGLTIAKQLAIRLGGDLRVESTVGSGSTFTLTLPIAGPPGAPEDRAPAAEVPPTPSVAVAVRLPGKTALIVDDDMRRVYSLSSTLHGAGLRVLTATDANEALATLAQTPGVDVTFTASSDVTRALRDDPRFQAMPVIELSDVLDAATALEQLRTTLGRAT